MKGWVAPGCSKPLPWIGPLTICFGRSKDMKYGIIESTTIISIQSCCFLVCVQI